MRRNNMFIKKYPSTTFWLFTISLTGVLVLNGIATEVNLGDESHHYRFAYNIYQAGKRLAFDPLYESGKPPGFYYHDPPLWHYLLAFIWRITGPSQVVAQIYHGLFFILAVWLTAILAKKRWGEEKKWFSTILFITVPMVVSFSIILYMDIPVTALSLLSFYFILQRRYIEGGFALGLAYLTKLNACFFIPGFLILILWHEREKVWVLLKSVGLFSMPFSVIVFLDHCWRRENIESSYDLVSILLVAERVESTFRNLTESQDTFRQYLISYMTNPVDIVRFLGLGLLVCLFIHIISFKRWSGKGIVFWIPVFSYLIAFFLLFGFNSDLRYIMPVVPFLAILCVESPILSQKRWIWMIVGVCILQFFSTTFYVYQRRLIPSEIKESYEFVRMHLPKNALVLYPEENLLIYGQRRIVWDASVRGNPGGLYSLLWAPDLPTMKRNLELNHINYIMIKKSRIYDDRIEKHTGGYPKSFVEKIPKLEGWEKIFENPGVSIWKRTQ